MQTTFGQALSKIADLPWNHALYLPPRSGWSEGSECTVLDPNDVADDEETPKDARDRGLKYALDVSTVQDIVANLREQGAQPDATLLMRAVCYYYDHDAFLSLPKR